MQGNDRAVLDLQRVERSPRGDDDIAVALKPLLQSHAGQNVVAIRERLGIRLAGTVTGAGRCLANRSASKASDSASGGEHPGPAEKGPAALRCS